MAKSKRLGIVRVGELYVDPEYQRQLNPKKVQRLVDKWNPWKLGVIIVSSREEKLWIVEGQHRWAAAKIVEGEDYLLDAQILSGFTQQEDADLFYGINVERTSIPSTTRFQSGLTAGYPIQVGVDRTLKDLGLIPQDCPKDTLQRLYERGGELKLRETLRAIDGAWGHMDHRSRTAAFGANVTKGVWFVLKRFPQISSGELSERLRKKDPRELRDSGTRGQVTYRTQPGRATAIEITKHLNTTRKKKLPFDPDGFSE